MWSRPQQAGRNVAIWLWSGLLLLVLAIAAKPQDSRGSRSGDQDPIPNENWWQYKCEIPDCHVFREFQVMPISPVICHKHNAIMKLVHDPRE
jgi:hypothetical protein